MPDNNSRKQYGLCLVVWALTLGLSAPGRSQSVAMPSGPPDVLALIFQRPGLGDQVGITYARTVPHAQAQRDLQTLAQAGGFTPEQIEITDAAAPVQGKIRNMTSASFVAANVIRNDTHTFPLEAFIGAFRGYKRLTLIGFAGSGFQFQGLHDYADNHVRIALEQHGSAYTYQIQILDSHFDRLNLPQSDAVTGQGTETRRTHRSPLALLLGILAAAGAAGILIFLLMTRLVSVPAKAEGSNKIEAPAEEETKIGPKG